MANSVVRVGLEKVVLGEHDLAILTITTGTQRPRTDYYLLGALPSDYGRGYRLWPVRAGQPPYDLLLDGRRSSCECLGFLRHGHCKHLDALKELRRRRRLRTRCAPVGSAQASRTEKHHA